MHGHGNQKKKPPHEEAATLVHPTQEDQSDLRSPSSFPVGRLCAVSPVSCLAAIAARAQEKFFMPANMAGNPALADRQSAHCVLDIQA